MAKTFDLSIPGAGGAASPTLSGTDLPASLSAVMAEPSFQRALADEQTPFVYVSSTAVRAAIARLQDLLPSVTHFHYSVKTNSLPEVLRICREHGLGCDVASEGELNAAVDAGFRADRILFGNTIKNTRSIERAHAVGVGLYAVDSEEEIRKVAALAPGAGVQVRLAALRSRGATWPSGPKFGTNPQSALDLLTLARDLGLKPSGLSMNVGSQQSDPDAWREAIAVLVRTYRDALERGLDCELINVGGGLPVAYSGADPLPPVCAAIEEALALGLDGLAKRPRILAEPGRAICAHAGILVASVVLATRRADTRWLYLDAGLWRGLIEAIGGAIRFPIAHRPDSGEREPTILAGMTCDSADVVYQEAPPHLPVGLREGDRLAFLAAGAYALSYASSSFNGMEPPVAIVAQ